jgi:hypothetical protein
VSVPQGSRDYVKPIASAEGKESFAFSLFSDFINDPAPRGHQGWKIYYVDRFLAQSLNVPLERWIKYEFVDKIRLRKRYRERCKKGVRRSKRRIGPSYCRRVRATLMNRRGKRSPVLLKDIGRRFTLFFDAADILPLTPKIWYKASLPIFSGTIR